jgi:hypothetical protein
MIPQYNFTLEKTFLKKYLFLLLLPWVVIRWVRGEAFYGLINTLPLEEQVMKTLRLNNGYVIPVVGTGTNLQKKHQVCLCFRHIYM